jgi:hypothetical protein
VAHNGMAHLNLALYFPPYRVAVSREAR